MKLPNNSSTWIQEAGKRGIDLQFLVQDKSKIYSRLDSLSLLRPLVHKKKSNGVLDFVNNNQLFEKNKNLFFRFIPAAGKRISINYSTIGELESLIKNEDISRFSEVHIRENDFAIKSNEIYWVGTSLYSGIIIIDPKNISYSGIIEILENFGDDPNKLALFHGHSKVPKNARIGITRRIEYLNNFSDFEKRIAGTAIKNIGGTKNPMPGYFEFEYHNNGFIVFRLYEEPSSSFAKLT